MKTPQADQTEVWTLTLSVSFPVNMLLNIHRADDEFIGNCTVNCGCIKHTSVMIAYSDGCYSPLHGISYKRRSLQNITIRPIIRPKAYYYCLAPCCCYKVLEQ